MSKGIIYVMTTVVPGLIKIGKTGTENFESRMYNLERHGYLNVGGLQRKFAIEVDSYDEKERLIGDIFAKSKVSNSELFALDSDLVVQLLTSFEGRQVFPEPEVVSKAEVFAASTVERSVNAEEGRLPDGDYFLEQNVRGFGVVKATMRVLDGVITLLKGSKCAPINPHITRVPEARRTAPIVNNILTEDVVVRTPSAAGWIALGHSNNGWNAWHDSQGNPISIYRTTPDSTI